MSEDKKDEQFEQPMIRFGGEWVPAHEVWNKLETANVVADAIDRFNNQFPHLSSADTRSVVPLVRERLKDMELKMPVGYNRPDLQAIAIELLDAMSPEDVLDVLREEHKADMGMLQLIQLAGEQPYLECLRREAVEFRLQRITAEQAAQLWNDAKRPAPGGGLWSKKKVDDLVNFQY